MKIIVGNEFIFCPLAFDQFCDDVDSLSRQRRDRSEISLKRMARDNQLLRISQGIKDSMNGIQRYVIIDFDNISLLGDRIVGVYLKDKKHVIIINTRLDHIVKRIKEDIPKYAYDEEEGCFFSDSDAQKYFYKNKKKIFGVYEKLEAEIVHKYTIPVKNEEIDIQEPMDSSNVYSNMYINTARLFLNPLCLRFIIYRLLCKIDKCHPNRSDINAFISASRTGSNIANLVGWLLGKKVIYCTNLGPKYSLSMQYLVDDIRANKNYVYLFDFLCLGTEAKLLNAILMVRGAELTEGYGIASYASNSTRLLDKMHTLVDINKNGFNYATVSEKTDLISIIRDEGLYEYEYSLSEL